MSGVVDLATITHGTPTERPPLVIAHGLFGSGRNWGVIAKRLSHDRLVVAVDMRNHGDSPRDSAQGYEEMAADLARVVEGHGGRGALLGHSMGGKAAMTLALTRPELIERLVVADIAPVAYGHDQMIYVRAMRGVDLAGLTRRAEVDARLAAAVDDAALRAFFLQSVAFGEGGGRWKLNLETLGREMPRIMGFPAVSGTYDGPALFVTGANSSYVQPEHWPRIATFFPAARRRVIPNAGHWLHADTPGPFLQAVASFLDGQSVPGPV